MTTITDAQFETIKDRFRDAVLIAIDEAAQDTARRLSAADPHKALGAIDDDLPALFATTDKLCKQSLARMGVTAIGDELLWKDPR